MANTVKRRSSSNGAKRNVKPRTSSSTQSNKKTKNVASRRTTRSRRSNSSMSREEYERNWMIARLCSFMLLLVVSLCMYGVIGGSIGPFIKKMFLGLIGAMGYILPPGLCLFLGYRVFNADKTIKISKYIEAGIITLCLGILLSHIMGTNVSELVESDELISDLYDEKTGGGLIFGLFAVLLFKLIGNFGSIFLIVVIALLCIFFMSEQSILSLFQYREREEYEDYEYDDEEDYEEQRTLRIERSKRIDEELRLDHEERRLRIEEKKLRIEEKRQAEEVRRAEEEERKEKLRIKEEQREDQRILNTSRPKEARGGDMLSNLDNAVPLLELKKKVSKDEIHEITIASADEYNGVEEDNSNLSFQKEPVINRESMRKESSEDKQDDLPEIIPVSEVMAPNDLPEVSDNDGNTPLFDKDEVSEEVIPEVISDEISAPSETSTESTNILLDDMPDPVTERTHLAKELEEETASPVVNDEIKEVPKPVKKKPYKTPDINLLTLNKNAGGGDSDLELKETGSKLQEALKTFGVNVTVDAISQGPSVTRYELKLEAGTKVSKINNLTDDIKLSLAATDVRIEAPIPGKSAVGIELPNKEASPVLIRDLLDNKTFKKSESKITFAVGKDISGETIVADIAKMPHMLIAGSTGSGKSVCINTLIMSILYKAHPDDVKLIMIDPKVVELSVYNGIPHLLLPVVTDPRKASAALKWAVDEMTKRYNSFAAFNVRDLKGYNAQVEGENQKGNLEAKKMPQIVVIVDELADLMMVASKEVEESICRLAQLARAAGIHLIIATQRPSVDVITGLIKANMPSRVAFKVSSGVDSRTILDMVGAERLLGKGDMLFYPQGYPKPLRVQGAFVSDEEVSKVVEFLKSNAGDDVYDEETVNCITGIAEGNAQPGTKSEGGASDDAFDQYFKEACRLVVDKEKASSGMLQRVYKIGFNRAARIIDQMEEIGIVGPEEGTKPRRVLVSKNELEDILSEI